MNPVAKTKTNDIISILSTLPNRAPANRFALRDCKKDAEAIAAHDQVAGFTVLGAIACMQHDNAGMHKFHRLAIECSGRSAYALGNYAVSLTKAFLWREDLPIYIEAFETDKTAEDLSFVISAHFRCGLIAEAVEYLKEWEKRFPQRGYPLKENLLEVANFLQSLPLKETEISEVVYSIADELAKTDCIVNTYRIVPVVEERHRYLNYEIEFLDPNSNIFDVEAQIDEAVLEGLDRRILDYLSVTFCTQAEESIASFKMASESADAGSGKLVNFTKIAELIKDVEPL